MKGGSMEVVMVEFAAGFDQVEECVEALTGLMRTLVAGQPRFHGATIHVEESTGTVINVMQWDRAQDFIDFRDANQDVIGPAIGRFGPKGRMLKIATEIKKQG
jgi:hypothetical protein